MGARRDTDGIDGSEDNAGALLTPDSLARAAALGLAPKKMLADNDGYGFFAPLGDLVVTGPTRTNVNDFRVILVQSAVDAAGWYDEGPSRLSGARAVRGSALGPPAMASTQAEAATHLAALADVRFELGDTDGASDDLERAVALRPSDPAIALLDATFLPWVYRDDADLERWRLRSRSGSMRFARNVASYRPQASLVLDLARSNFLLAYQGRDDLGLRQTLGTALSELLRHACPRFLEPRKAGFAQEGPSWLRVGVPLHECAIGRYFGSWIEGLDPAQFEEVGIHARRRRDAYTARLARSCIAMHSLHAPVLDVAQRIVDADLDILIYPEFGMEPRTPIALVPAASAHPARGLGPSRDDGQPRDRRIPLVRSHGGARARAALHREAAPAAGPGCAP